MLSYNSVHYHFFMCMYILSSSDQYWHEVKKSMFHAILSNSYLEVYSWAQQMPHTIHLQLPFYSEKQPFKKSPLTFMFPDFCWYSKSTVNKELPQRYNNLVDFKILQLKMYLLKGLFMFLKTSVFCLLFTLGGSSFICGVWSFLSFLPLKMNSKHLTVPAKPDCEHWLDHLAPWLRFNYWLLDEYHVSDPEWGVSAQLAEYTMCTWA